MPHLVHQVSNHCDEDSNQGQHKRYEVWLSRCYCLSWIISPSHSCSFCSRFLDRKRVFSGRFSLVRVDTFVTFAEVRTVASYCFFSCRITSVRAVAVPTHLIVAGCPILVHSRPPPPEHHVPGHGGRHALKRAQLQAITNQIWTTEHVSTWVDPGKQLLINIWLTLNPKPQRSRHTCLLPLPLA